jgi:LysM repeat protein
MKTHTVKSGETLSGIARHYGLPSWQALYNDPSNEAFRKKRSNPNLIFPGDQINIPDGTAATTNTANYVMAIIDGTGDSDDDQYSKDMQNSFCKQLERGIEPKRRHYWRGPSTSGSQVADEAEAAYRYLSDAKKANPDTRLMLAGYSRGGSAAIMAAELLQLRDNFNVDALFLFDAVARHTFKGGEIIPSNVLFSAHVHRQLTAYLLLKYEGTISDAQVKGVTVSGSMSNPMRPFFGNTGLQYRGSGTHHTHSVVGSHGAMGGVGWSFITEDKTGQADVAAWMNGQLQSQGVWNGLASFDPPHTQPLTPSAFQFITGFALDLVLLAKHKKHLETAGAAH